MPSNPTYPKLSSLVSINELPDQLGFIKTDNPSPANIMGEARAGSGGNYLSNEIMYRVARLRNNSTSIPVAKTGHIHIPEAPVVSSQSKNLSNLIIKIKEIIKNASNGL